MPRSVKRRIELLERRPPPGPGKGRPGWLLGQIEMMVQDNHPWASTPAFQAAWTAYLEARKRVEAEPSPPPERYQPKWPAADRVRMWNAFDDPRLLDVTNDMLRAFVDAAKAGPPG
jgi:hypothetical protein